MEVKYDGVLLDEGVVDARRDPAPRSEQTRLAEPVAEEPGGVLSSSIRMNDRSGLGSAPPPGHLERVDDHLGGDRSEIDQPTMRRELASMTAAQ